MHVVYFWLTMGHYHFARMKAIAALPTVTKLTVIEAADLDDHFWKRNDVSTPFDVVTLCPGEVLNHAITGKAWDALPETLSRLKPDIFVNGAGYFHPKGLIRTQGWNRRTQGKLVLWTESTEWDQKRFLAKELLKRQILKKYDAALVAGTRHKSYLKKLGFPEARIQITGNVVDNNFFEARESEKRHGFLYVGRMLSIKNVSRLIDAYALYRKESRNPQPLYLVGDGPDKSKLEEKVSREDIPGVVFTGNLQIQDVTSYYRQSRYFILPSMSEPWGLVVNEALASGLPVGISERCGCMPDLIHEGKNGFVFAPDNIHDIAAVLLRLDSLSEAQYRAMSEFATCDIQRFTPEKYAVNCEKIFTKLME